jgi:hypothetical protein
MSRENGRAIFRGLFEKPAARCAGALLVLTKRAVPVRTIDLKGLMHDVAAEERLLSLARELDSDVTRAVPRGRMERKTVPDRSLAIDDLGLSALDNGKNAVLEYAGAKAFLASRAGPMIVLGLGEDVLGIRERRHLAAVEESRVPAAMIRVQVGTADVVDLFG